MSHWLVGLVAIGLGAVSLGACTGSSPSGPDRGTEIVVDPIQVTRVEVRILEGSPPAVAAHVQGVVGDGCSALHSLRQERSGNSVTVTILRQRPRDAICIQIARLYDEVIPLEGRYPPGRYSLRVNGVETTFSTE